MQSQDFANNPSGSKKNALAEKLVYNNHELPPDGINVGKKPLMTPQNSNSRRNKNNAFLRSMAQYDKSRIAVEQSMRKTDHYQKYRNM